MSDIHQNSRLARLKLFWTQAGFKNAKSFADYLEINASHLSDVDKKETPAVLLHALALKTDLLRRSELGLGVREMCRLTDHGTLISEPISPAYYSRLERGVDVDPAKLSLEKCWSLGLVLHEDPLQLFVLSRSAIDRRYLDLAERVKLFHIDSPESPSFTACIHDQRVALGLGMRELCQKIAKSR